MLDTGFKFPDGDHYPIYITPIQELSKAVFQYGQALTRIYDISRPTVTRTPRAT